jgi:hypothetical protein
MNWSGSKPGLRVEIPASNRLIRGTACVVVVVVVVVVNTVIT